MRCLAALARWEELSDLCKDYWTPADPVTRLEIAPMVGYILLSLLWTYSTACVFGTNVSSFFF